MGFRVSNDSRKERKGFGIKKITYELIQLAPFGFLPVGSQRLFELKASWRNYSKTETDWRSWPHLFPVQKRLFGLHCVWKQWFWERRGEFVPWFEEGEIKRGFNFRWLMGRKRPRRTRQGQVAQGSERNGYARAKEVVEILFCKSKSWEGGFKKESHRVVCYGW